MFQLLYIYVTKLQSSIKKPTISFYNPVFYYFELFLFIYGCKLINKKYGSKFDVKFLGKGSTLYN